MRKSYFYLLFAFSALALSTGVLAVQVSCHRIGYFKECTILDSKVNKLPVTCEFHTVPKKEQVGRGSNLKSYTQCWSENNSSKYSCYINNPNPTEQARGCVPKQFCKKFVRQMSACN